MLRRAALLICAAALAWTVAGTARAEDGPGLALAGKPIHLKSGLLRTGDGAVWIARSDLEAALSAHAKQLIPRPADGRRRRQRAQKQSWILCDASRCGVYRGETSGTHANPFFDLAKAAKVLGYGLRQRAGRYDLIPPTRAARTAGVRRARIGARVSDLTLTFADGTRRRIAGQRGKRLLIMVWASWSPTRALLGPWRASLTVRNESDLEVWFVALDVEGARHVRGYAPLHYGIPIAIDRNADLARIFRLDKVGRWFLIDELGILRAEGDEFAAPDRIWLDEHLREEVVKSKTPALAARRAGNLPELRARVEAEPDSVPARLALAEALAEAPGGAHVREAIRNARALVALRPQSMPFAFRLTGLLLDTGDRMRAVNALDEARRRTPRLWTLRKQYWALVHPERFYDGEIDLAWQKVQRKKERAWLDPPRARRKKAK